MSLLQNYMGAVQEACQTVQSHWVNYQSQEYDSGCTVVPACNPLSVLKSGWYCNESYGQGSNCNCTGLYISPENAVLVSDNTVNVPPSTLCRVSQLGVLFKLIAQKYMVYTLHMGLPNGLHLSWPARLWNTQPILPPDPQMGCRRVTEMCPNFDPRNRIWYPAASSLPKNILFVLDISGSMGSENRLDIAKSATLVILGTLYRGDWVGVISFSDVVSSPTSQLVPVNSTNIYTLTNWINNLNVSSEPTSYEVVFKSIFSFFGNTQITQGCSNVIVFFSDGVPSTGATGSVLADYVSTQNHQTGVNLFTFQVGSPPPTSKDILLTLSCQNQGLNIKLSDKSNLRGKMSGFFKFFESGTGQRGPVFVEPFVGCCGMGLIGVIAMPCYDTGSGEMIGVIGTSIPIRDLTGRGISIESLLNDNKKPCNHTITPTQIDSLRTSPCSIVQQPPPNSDNLTSGDIVGIVMIILVGGAIILGILSWFFSKFCNFYGSKLISISGDGGDGGPIGHVEVGELKKEEEAAVELDLDGDSSSSSSSG